MPSLPQFWDRSKERAWRRADMFVARLAANPADARLVAGWIEAHWASDPSARRNLLLWRNVLDGGLPAIADRLMRDDDDGELLRDTIPPVFPIGARERADMMRKRNAHPARA